MTPESDAAAIARSLDDGRAFVAVFDRHYAAVHGYASRRAGPDLADEVAAETFARAFDRRATYDLAYPDARPWLLAIASNLLRRHWRSERRRLEAWARAQAGRPVTEAVPDGVAAELVAALDALPTADREALLLYAWGELSYEEIAQALGCPVGTVRSRISRARGRLRATLNVPEDSHA
jgi:RNA polymerase sigma-70 factor (ECF subfamily)